MSLISHRPVMDSITIPADRLRLALLAGSDRELRRHIERAGHGAPEVRLQIRRAAHTRPLQVRGLRSGQVHLMAMPVLLNFGGRGAISPAEIGLFPPGSELASRVNAIWRSVMGDVHDVRALSHAIHLEAVLGISPSAVHEFAFFGASVVEGMRKELPRLRFESPRLSWRPVSVSQAGMA